MGTTPDLEAAAIVQIKFRRALALALVVATISFVGTHNMSGQLFFTAPVAADTGSQGTAEQSQGSAVAGSDSFSADDFESSIGGRYGGFDVAVLSARGLPVNNSGAPIVAVELAVRNATNRQLRLPESMFGLQTEPGALVPIHRFEHTEHSTRLVIEPGTITTATLVVRLPLRSTTDIDLYRLAIGEPYRQPLLLPLVREPAVAGASGVTTGSEIGIEPNPSTKLTVLDLASTYNHRAYRALVDHHLLVLTADVELGTNTPADVVAKSGWWSVVFDDQRIAAARVEIDSLTGSSIRVTVVFETPVAVSRLALVTGEGGSADIHQADLSFSSTLSR